MSGKRKINRNNQWTSVSTISSAEPREPSSSTSSSPKKDQPQSPIFDKHSNEISPHSRNASNEDQESSTTLERRTSFDGARKYDSYKPGYSQSKMKRSLEHSPERRPINNRTIVPEARKKQRFSSGRHVVYVPGGKEVGEEKQPLTQENEVKEEDEKLVEVLIDENVYEPIVVDYDAPKEEETQSINAKHEAAIESPVSAAEEISDQMNIDKIPDEKERDGSRRSRSVSMESSRTTHSMIAMPGSPTKSSSLGHRLSRANSPSQKRYGNGKYQKGFRTSSNRPTDHHSSASGSRRESSSSHIPSRVESNRTQSGSHESERNTSRQPSDPAEEDERCNGYLAKLQILDMPSVEFSAMLRQMSNHSWRYVSKPLLQKLVHQLAHLFQKRINEEDYEPAFHLLKVITEVGFILKPLHYDFLAINDVAKLVAVSLKAERFLVPHQVLDAAYYVRVLSTYSSSVKLLELVYYMLAGHQIDEQSLHIFIRRILSHQNLFATTMQQRLLFYQRIGALVFISEGGMNRVNVMKILFEISFSAFSHLEIPCECIFDSTEKLVEVLDFYILKDVKEAPKMVMLLALLSSSAQHFTRSDKFVDLYIKFLRKMNDIEIPLHLEFLKALATVSRNMSKTIPGLLAYELSSQALPSHYRNEIRNTIADFLLWLWSSYVKKLVASGSRLLSFCLEEMTFVASESLGKNIYPCPHSISAYIDLSRYDQIGFTQSFLPLFLSNFEPYVNRFRASRLPLLALTEKLFTKCQEFFEDARIVEFVALDSSLREAAIYRILSHTVDRLEHFQRNRFIRLIVNELANACRKDSETPLRQFAAEFLLAREKEDVASDLLDSISVIVNCCRAEDREQLAKKYPIQLALVESLNDKERSVFEAMSPHDSVVPETDRDMRKSIANQISWALDDYYKMHMIRDKASFKEICKTLTAKALEEVDLVNARLPLTISSKEDVLPSIQRLVDGYFSLSRNNK